MMQEKGGPPCLLAAFSIMQLLKPRIMFDMPFPSNRLVLHKCFMMVNICEKEGNLPFKKTKRWVILQDSHQKAVGSHICVCLAECGLRIFQERMFHESASGSLVSGGTGCFLPRLEGRVSTLCVKGQIINRSGFACKSLHQGVCRYSTNKKTYFSEDLFDKIPNIVRVIEYPLWSTGL